MASRLPYKVQPLTQAVLQPVQVSDMGASAYAALANEADSIARQFQPAVNEKAAAAGAASVTTGPDGKPVFNPKLSINEATAAYNNAGEATYLTQLAPRVRERVAAAVEEANFDIEKFRASASGLNEGFLQDAPARLAGSIQTLVARETASAENSLIERKQTRDQKMAQGSVLAEIGNLEDKLSAYAAQDGLGTPEAMATLSDYRNLLDLQVSNPLFNVSPEMADSQYRNLESRLVALTAEQKAVKVLDTQGLDAAKSFIRDTIYDPALALSEQERAHYESAATSGVRQRLADVRAARAEAQAATNDLVGDAEAMASRTGEWRSKISDDKIVSVYGESKGRKIIEGLDFQASVYNYGKEIASASPAEISKILAELKPDPSGGTDSYGFRRDAVRYDALLSAVETRNKALRTDPANYVVQTTPRVQSLWEGAGTDPKANQAAAKATMKEQARLGTAPDKIVPLTGAQASGLVSEYLALDQPQDRSDKISTLAERFGPLWPRVQAQLVEAGMPAGVAVLGTMTSPTQTVPRATLAAAMAVGPDKLKAIIGEDANEISKTVRSYLEDFDRTLALQNGGAATAAQFHKSVETLAYQYRAEGASTSAAADRATKEVVTSQYNFRDTYRVPVSHDIDAVENAADYALEKLDTYGIAPITSLDTRLSVDEATRQYVDAVRTNGYFITNEDETGLLLVDEQGKPVETKDGGDIEFTFDELARARGRASLLSAEPYSGSAINMIDEYKNSAGLPKLRSAE